METVSHILQANLVSQEKKSLMPVMLKGNCTYAYVRLFCDGQVGIWVPLGPPGALGGRGEVVLRPPVGQPGTPR